MGATLRSSPPSRFLAILNPSAGNGRCARRAPAALDRIRRAGIEIEVRTTQAPGHARELAAAGYRDGHRDFLAIGGDGTAFEVANGCMSPTLNEGEPASLGLLPLGTGNSFVEHFRDSLRHRSSPSRRIDGVDLFLAAIERGAPRRCDLLLLEHRDGCELVLGTVSFGFAAQVSSLVNRRFKPLGLVGYTLGVLACMAALRTLDLHATVRLGTARSTAPSPSLFFALQNIVQVGGNMRMAPGADPEDGVFELVTVGPVGRFELLRAFPRIFRGTHLSHPAVDCRRADRFDIDGERALLVMLDGEVQTLVPRSVSLVPGALPVWI